MIKYSEKLKVKIVNEYLIDHVSYTKLSEIYNMDDSIIRRWVQLAKIQGMDALKVRWEHRSFSLDQKLDVVRYYQTHDEGAIMVGAKFDLCPSQVTSWARIFNEQGAAGLRPKRKGRSSIMQKKDAKKVSDELHPSEREALLQENMELRAKLHNSNMERDILKKMAAVSKNKTLPQRHQ